MQDSILKVENLSFSFEVTGISKVKRKKLGLQSKTREGSLASISRLTTEKKAFFIENLNFDLKKNDFFIIIGPNGSGKTTLLQLCIGNLASESGEIILKGRNLKYYNRIEKSKILAYLPQKIPLDLHIKVLDYVVMGRYAHKALFEDYNENDYEVARLYIKKLNLERFVSRDFATLSGGEQRRVMLASALAAEAQILVLDEPDAFLDIGYRKEFFQLLKRINLIENKTIFLASHDLSISFQYADRVCGLKNGQILFVESKENITSKMLSSLFNTDVDIIRYNDREIIAY
jgi:iron complex transport system ATP-binding protein